MKIFGPLARELAARRKNLIASRMEEFYNKCHDEDGRFCEGEDGPGRVRDKVVGRRRSGEDMRPRIGESPEDYRRRIAGSRPPTPSTPEPSRTEQYDESVFGKGANKYATDSDLLDERSRATRPFSRYSGPALKFDGDVASEDSWESYDEKGLDSPHVKMLNGRIKNLNKKINDPRTTSSQKEEYRKALSQTEQAIKDYKTNSKPWISVPVDPNKTLSTSDIQDFKLEKYFGSGNKPKRISLRDYLGVNGLFAVARVKNGETQILNPSSSHFRDRLKTIGLEDKISPKRIKELLTNTDPVYVKTFRDSKVFHYNIPELPNDEFAIAVNNKGVIKTVYPAGFRASALKSKYGKNGDLMSRLVARRDVLSRLRRSQSSLEEQVITPIVIPNIVRIGDEDLILW